MASDPVYTVTKRVLGLAVLTTAVAETFGANAIDLAGLPGSASLIAAFDIYRFNTIEVEFLPRLNVADTVGLLAGANPGIFVSAVDLNDVTVSTSINDILEFPGAKCWNVNCDKSRLVHKFVPRHTTGVLAAALAVGGTSGPSWLNTTASTVVHYGVRYGNTVATAGVNIFDLCITVNVSFRRSK